MCGRYYVDDDTAREIEKVVRQADERMRQAAENSVTLQPKDIHPTDLAPVLVVSNGTLCCKWQRWGFPGQQGKQIIFIASFESVLEKKMYG